MNVDLNSLRRELEDLLGWPDLRLAEMPGATSAMLFAVSSPAGEAVARIFDTARWETAPAELSHREALILSAIENELPITTPRLLACLQDNGVVMSRLSGAVWLPADPDDDWLAALATTLGAIHAAPVQLPFRYESWNNLRGADPPAWWPDADLWSALQLRLSAPPEARPALLHRDYHPTNVLWSGQKVSGVVDWVNACLGPAAVDVAHCRLNLALMYGMPAADTFLDAYREDSAGFEYPAFWDLDAALSSMPNVRPYPPWQTFGLTGLTTVLVRQRLLAFVRQAVDNA